MANPNNCATCEYSQLNGNREKWYCYMFREEPTDVCMKHTGRAKLPPLVQRARNNEPKRKTSIYERAVEFAIANHKLWR